MPDPKNNSPLSPTAGGDGRSPRRVRYAGTHPRHFTEKYKEHNPDQHPDTIAKVVASGKTPAGTHRPIMVGEVLECLDPRPGNAAVDATLGYGGHSLELLPRLQPGGHLLAIDVDPLQLPQTEARLRNAGFGPDILTIHRGNFGGLLKALHAANLPGADLILADLGTSSMQLDDPSRGFSMKHEGPLDMRLNPHHGTPASALLKNASANVLAEIFRANADEPHAEQLAEALAGKAFSTTTQLSAAIAGALAATSSAERDLTIRRVFQALRIEVNDEFSALETFLRQVRSCLNPGGRVAVLTFHSGEDRRVKKAFAAGRADGFYSAVAENVERPSPAERASNPRSSSAKLRWARRAP